MTEKKKSLEKISFGIGLMFIIYWIYSLFIQESLRIPTMYKSILGLMILYGLGLVVLLRIIKDIPSYNIRRNRIPFRVIIKCFLLQFTALVASGIIAYGIALMKDTEISNQMNSKSPYMLFVILVFSPIAEEFVFRKLFADKLLQYGEELYIFASSFCFAIVHLVSIGIPQMIYTFILGIIWSYLYVKSGNLLIPIVLHSLSNLFGGIMIQEIQGISKDLFGIYSILVLLLSIIGLIWLVLSSKNIILNSKNKFLARMLLVDVFSNKGIIFNSMAVVIFAIMKNLL